MQGKRILITGGAGFIGSTLAGKLLEDNEVVLYDNLTRNALREQAFHAHRNLELIEGDILDAERLTRHVRELRPTHIVHCAAIAGIDTVVHRPVRTMEVNMLGTAYLLRAASTVEGVERVVCFSTSEVFGRHAFMSSEAHDAVVGEAGEARWTYAVSKLAGEHLALAYHREQGLPTTVLRPFNVYGPGQVGEGALSTFVQRALRSEEIQIHGTGSQIRAWCYIDDMVRGVLLALEHPRAVGETFNIGNERSVVTIYELARQVVQLLESASKIRFVPPLSVDVELRVPDGSKARELLGFDAEVELGEGIQQTAASYRDRLLAHA